MTVVVPPATLGILGGGQLGRMTALAARSMGFRVHVLDPDPHCAAEPVVERVVAAAFSDVAGAEELARGCDVVTIEIEQVSTASLEAASRHAPVRPGASVLGIVQHRGRQKEWLAANGFPIGPWRMVTSSAELDDAIGALGAPLFVKVCEGGYDGRGQLRLETGVRADVAFAELGQRPSVAEQGLDLELELSVMVARRASGETVAYPPAVNHHVNQQLEWSVLPGELPPDVVREAKRLACTAADALALEGILAVEMFLLRDGRLLVNELAPRPHNSYHASELACPTSQFEQLVRAVCDLPLGIVEPARPAAIVNVFGDLWLDGRTPDVQGALAVPGTRLFLYGKHGPRAGRKMGHLAALGDDPADAVRRAQEAGRRLAKG